MAGLIPESFIQELLARTDIVEVIGARIELKRAGREYKARSPFTNEKTPSFFVSPAKQMYFDFSSGMSGSVIRFLMEYDRLSFPEAVAELAHRAGLEIPVEKHGKSTNSLQGPLDALAEAARLYRNELRRAPRAIEYLRSRGVSGEAAKLFGIGFAPASWNFLSQHFPDPRHALAAGLLRQNKARAQVYDVFRNRVMFPIRDTRGRVIGFGGRALDEDPAKYLNSPETSLFHKGHHLFGLYEARQSSKGVIPYLLVVEGYMDAVMLAQYGFRNVVATLGTSTTKEHLALLFRASSRILFCFDGDRAGRSAARRAMESVLPEISGDRECRFMFLPEGHDPDSLVRSIGAKGFVTQLDEALPLSEFLISELRAQTDLDTLDGRARLIGLARPYFSRLPEGALRAMLQQQLAQLSHLPLEEVGRLLRPDGSRNVGQVASVRSIRPATTRSVQIALRALIERPSLAQEVTDVGQIAEAPDSGVAILVDALEFFIERPDGTPGQLAEYWRGTPNEGKLEYFASEPLPFDSEEERIAVFASAIQRLRYQALRKRLKTLLEGVPEGELRAVVQSEAAAINAQLAEIKAGLKSDKAL